MNYRLANRNDLPAMLEIYRPYVENDTASFEYETPSLAAFAARLEAVTAAFPWYVAEEDGVVAGYAYASRAFERAAYQWDADMSVYIAAPFHGRGIGRALYALLERDLVRMGYVNAYALVTVENGGSIAFHERVGYHLVAELPASGYKFGRWLGVKWYMKVLCDAPDPGPAPIPFPELNRQEE